MKVSFLFFILNFSFFCRTAEYEGVHDFCLLPLIKALCEEEHFTYKDASTQTVPLEEQRSFMPRPRAHSDSRLSVFTTRELLNKISELECELIALKTYHLCKMSPMKLRLEECCDCIRKLNRQIDHQKKLNASAPW